MPEPPSREQKLQRLFEEAGCSPEQLKVIEVSQRRKGAPLRIEIEATPEMAEALIKLAGVRAFDPDKPSPIKVSIPEGIDRDDPVEPGVKRWTAAERRKRSKPKPDTPDLP